MSSNNVCPKCGGGDISFQVAQTDIHKECKKDKRGILWWCLVGWWLEPFRWSLMLCTFGLLGRRKKKISVETKIGNSTMAVCQSCGHTWKVK